MRAFLPGLAGLLILAAANGCGLFFADREGTSSGTGGAGGIEEPGPGCRPLEGGAFATFDQTIITDIKLLGDRVYFAGCAYAGALGLPGVAGEALFVASVGAGDLCDLQVTLLTDRCGETYAVEIADGDAGLTVGWARSVGQTDSMPASELCVVNAATSAAPWTLPGCPNDAFIACEVVDDPPPELRVSSVVHIGDAVAAVFDVVGPAELVVNCSIPGGQVVPMGRSVVVRSGQAPAVTVVQMAVSAMSVAPTGEDDTLSVVARCADGSSCSGQIRSATAALGALEAATFEQEIPGWGTTFDFPPVATSAGWGATVGDGNEVRHAWRGGPAPTSPQMPVTSSDVILAGDAAGDGAQIFCGASFAEVSPMNYQSRGFVLFARDGLSAELIGQHGILGTHVPGCTGVYPLGAAYDPGPRAFIVGGLYRCGELDFASGRGVPAGAALPAMYLLRQELPP